MRSIVFSALLGAVTLGLAPSAGAESSAVAAAPPDSLTFDKAIRTMAVGCDAFTPTWASDDKLYTGFGDCNGLERQLSPKRSMGFGSIAGSPGRLALDDLDTGSRGAPDIQKSGSGGGLDAIGNRNNGEKPASMLALGGTLYAWVRNIDDDGTNARIKYSRDFKKASSSWSWASWTSEFGFPVFVQTGKDGAGSGGYVYVVAHDGVSAYKPSGRFILMRVPPSKILQQSAYEFFSGTADKPAWVGYADRGRRTGILTDPGRCMRSGVSYNPARGRYYLWQQIPNEDRGLGIYSAPNVWGPWTRLFYTESWDTPAGERGEFPVKWMDQAGIGQQGTMYLLFSGGDRLSVRKATVKPGY